MKVDMSRHAITRRLQRVSELVRVCRALAGPRRRKQFPAEYGIKNHKSKIP